MQGAQHTTTVEVADIAALLPLRQRVLRPGRAPETCHFDGDERATHIVLKRGSEVIGITTWLQNPHPNGHRGDWWQLRGMAVAPERHGEGVGRALLNGAVAHLRSQGHFRLWCNSRCSAQGFYERCGWSVVSEEFTIPLVGPHVVMQWGDSRANLHG
ncbi:MAG: GNAT superfamily N-acetyltransferase [Bradymonadia bacterium]|jgi:GNAT superfamily N-acetyltransferase